MPRRKVAQDRVRLPDGEVSVLQHGNQTVRVQRPKFRFVQPPLVAASRNMLVGENPAHREPENFLDVEGTAPSPTLIIVGGCR